MFEFLTGQVFNVNGHEIVIEDIYLNTVKYRFNGAIMKAALIDRCNDSSDCYLETEVSYWETFETPAGIIDARDWVGQAT